MNRNWEDEDARIPIKNSAFERSAQGVVTIYGRDDQILDIFGARDVRAHLGRVAGGELPGFGTASFYSVDYKPANVESAEIDLIIEFGKRHHMFPPAYLTWRK